MSLICTSSPSRPSALRSPRDFWPIFNQAHCMPDGIRRALSSNEGKKDHLPAVPMLPCAVSRSLTGK